MIKKGFMKSIKYKYLYLLVFEEINYIVVILLDGINNEIMIEIF